MTQKSCNSWLNECSKATGVRKNSHLANKKVFSEKYNCSATRSIFLLMRRMNSPVDFIVTNGSCCSTEGAAAERPRAHELLVRLRDRTPKLVEHAKYLNSRPRLR